MTDLDSTLFHSRLSMSSREIAELCEKRHDNVLRDTDSLIEQLETNSNLRSLFKSSTYKDTQGISRRCYEYSKEGSLLLVSGYDARIRLRLIERWMELENQSRYGQIPNFDDPIAAAEAWIVERKGKLEAERQVRIKQEQMKIQQEQIERNQPKVDFHDEVAARDGDIEIADAAKTLLGGKRGVVIRLREFLIEQGWVTRRSNGYQATVKATGAGWMKTIPSKVGPGQRQIVYAVITGKGLVRIRHLLRAEELFSSGDTPPFADTDTNA